MSQKSILEQALLQVNTLEEAVKQNAKGILSSVMKQELNDLLKEQAEDEELNLPDEEAQDVTGEEPGDEETSISDETADDTESEDEEGEPSLDDEDSEEEFADEPEADEEDVLDMTSASDEEVLKVFKAMKPEDGIVVKKDGDTISFSDDNDEYIIKLDQEVEDEEETDFSMEDEDEDESEFSMDEINEDEETVYEITLDEDEIALDQEVSEEEDSEEMEVSEEEEEDDTQEVEATEAARTFANDARKPATQGKKFKAGRHEMNEEVEKLKKQNSEYKKALLLFKDKLNEVAVFNANLAYATRLFTEHSTTKQEKLNILKRFDTISTITESKNLYSSIKSELDTKKPMTESVVEKLISTPTTSSTEVLSEAKAYENPQFKRMKDLMSKIK